MADKKVVTANWNQLLENMSHWDKDERYMATNDLCVLLNDNVKIDPALEQKICAGVLKQLDDKSNDVQSVAVKCLGALLKKVHESQTLEISRKLASLVVDTSKDALRDIYSIGLKTLIADVPASVGPNIFEPIATKLVGGISQQTSDDVKRESLDNLSELLKRFGQCGVKEHANIMSVVVAQLKHPKDVIPKRAAQCLGSLAVVSSDTLLTDLVQALLTRINELDKSGKASMTSTETRTLIQTIGTISRSVGFRLGKILPQIVPLFVRFCKEPEDDDEESHSNAANELRESCFLGFESFVLRCPKEVAQFIPEILRVSLWFLKYDPNYSYDDEDGMDVEEDEETYDDDDYGDGGDDDDTSWKVRKAAVKTMQSMAAAHALTLPALFPQCADALIGRFKEREENVRLDVIACFFKFIECSAPAVSSAVLSPRIDAVINASLIQLNGQSVKTKESVLLMLKQVTISLQGGLDRHMNKLAPHVEKLMLDNKTQSLKLSALVLFRYFLQLHNIESMGASIVKLVPIVVKIVQESWNKTISEAIRVLSAVVVCIRPYNATTKTYAALEHISLVEPIYGAILKRLSVLDIDVEIKEASISAMATLVCHCGDGTSALSLGQITDVFHLLHSRLENETTRIPALRAISLLATQSALNLAVFFNQSIKHLALFLKQSSRSLRQLALQTLNALLNHSVSVESLTVEDAQFLTKETAGVLSSNDDFHLLSLTLALIRTVIQVFRSRDAGQSLAIVDCVNSFVFKHLISLSRSSATATQQASVQTQLIALFQELIACGSSSISFESTFDELYYQSFQQIANPVSKQSLNNLSKCVAGLFAAQSSSTVIDGIKRFAKDSQVSPEDEQQDLRVQLALLTMGETGQNADLSSLPDLQGILLSCFGQSVSEDIKYAAAYALGHVAIGSMSTFLPLIIQSVNEATSEPRKQYLLLVSLREILLAFVQNLSHDFGPHFGTILPILHATSNSSQDESVRNMVADCFGILTTINPINMIPVLTSLLENREMKAALQTAVNALRSAVSRQLSPSVFSALSNILPSFFVLLDEEDLDVKKAALVMVNTAAHQNAPIIENHVVATIFPVLLKTLEIKLERTVDLGPFKHKVDDNLPLRKMCLNILDVILDFMPDKFDAVGVLQISAKLLTDHEDIRASFLQLLPKIANVAPTTVSVNADEMVPLIEDSLTKACKSADKGGRDVLRIMVKAILQLSRLEEMKLSRKWPAFVESSRKNPNLTDLFFQVEILLDEKLL